MSKKWVGVMLEGTLQQNGKANDEAVLAIKKLIADGREVKIVTREVAVNSDSCECITDEIRAAAEWRGITQDFLESLGLPRLDVRNCLDLNMDFLVADGLPSISEVLGPLKPS